MATKSHSHGGEPIILLVRIYGVGSDRFIDRKKEMKVRSWPFLWKPSPKPPFLQLMEYLGNKAIAPRLIASFSNGLIYEYMEGRNITLDELGSNFMPAIASEMARWHLINVEEALGECKTQLFSRLQSWLHQVPKAFANPSLQARIETIFPLDQLASEVCK